MKDKRKLLVMVCGFPTRGHDASQITLALGTAASYPRACQALGAMLSRGALNPADITVLFKMFTSMDPPPVELVSRLGVGWLVGWGGSKFPEFTSGRACSSLLKYFLLMLLDTRSHSLAQAGLRQSQLSCPSLSEARGYKHGLNWHKPSSQPFLVALVQLKPGPVTF